MGDPDKSGLSTLDLMSSSPSVNRVVRAMLKKSQMSYRELYDMVTRLPEDKRLTPQMLQDALNTLITMGWLGREGDGEDAIYSVVLKPKASSSEQLHSSELPPLEVAGDRKMDPGLNAPEVRVKSEEAKQSQGFGDKLKSLFDRKK